jgi:protein-S-isoprenylcysteine O-methyltransferase Ste14
MAPTTQASAKPANLVLRRFMQLFSFIVLLGLVLFISAGRLDWPGAWIFLVSYLILIVTNGLIMLPRNRGLIEERAQQKENVKGWDARLVKLNTLVVGLGLMMTAGLDVRFGWSHPLASWTLPAGLLLLLAGYVLSAWSMLVNHYFSTYVRIQEDRGHQVVSSGPYAVVRHPGYVGIMLTTLAMPLVLGSGWAFLPSLLSTALMAVRTHLEDRTLRAELEGYQEYAHRVRFRLLPLIW